MLDFETGRYTEFAVGNCSVLIGEHFEVSLKFTLTLNSSFSNFCRITSSFLALPAPVPPPPKTKPSVVRICFLLEEALLGFLELTKKSHSV